MTSFNLKSIIQFIFLSSLVHAMEDGQLSKRDIKTTPQSPSQQVVEKKSLYQSAADLFRLYLDELDLEIAYKAAIEDVALPLLKAQVESFDLHLTNKPDVPYSLNVSESEGSSPNSFTVALALGGQKLVDADKIMDLNLRFERSTIPQQVDLTQKNATEIVIEGIVKSTLMMVVEQYKSALLTSISSDVKTTAKGQLNLLNESYFTKAGYFNPSKIRIITLSEGKGANTEGLWMIQMKSADSKEWTRKLIVKEVKTSSASGELSALKAVRESTLISMVAAGGAPLKINRSEVSPTYLPKLTYDIAQYTLTLPEKENNTRYLTVLGMAKGQAIWNHYLDAVKEAGEKTSVSLDNLDKYQTYLKAMEAAGKALSQFHQATNKCALEAKAGLKNSPNCYLFSYYHGDGHPQNIFYDDKDGEMGTVYWIDNATMATVENPSLLEILEDPYSNLLGQVRGMFFKSFKYTQDNTFVASKGAAPLRLVNISADVSYFYLRPFEWLLVQNQWPPLIKNIDHSNRWLEIFLWGNISFLKAYVQEYPAHVQNRIRSHVYEDFLANINHDFLLELLKDSDNPLARDNWPSFLEPLLRSD